MAPRRPREPRKPSPAPLGLSNRQQQSAPQIPHQRHSDRRSTDDDARRFLTGPQVCERYSISDMSLWRWLNDPEIGFPQPALRVKDRRYFLEADLIAWERARAARHAEIKRAGTAGAP
jgi:predicted DNA-binding transcriptional regulator AlpA